MNLDSNIPTTSLWYYAINDNVYGPVTVTELEQLLNDGEILPTTLAVEQGKEDWTPIQILFPELTPEVEPIAERTDDQELSEEEEGNTTFPYGRWLRNAALFYALLIAGEFLTRDSDGSANGWFVIIASIVSWNVYTVVLSKRMQSIWMPPAVGLILACLTPMLLIPFAKPRSSESSETKASVASNPPVPAKAYVPPSVNHNLKAELLGLFDELQDSRYSADFHRYGSNVVGNGEWAVRLKSLYERALKVETSVFNDLANAVAALEGLGHAYHRSKGRETDISRTSRKLIEDRIGEPRVVTRRRLSDFDVVLSGTSATTIGGITVRTLGDVIAGAMGSNIDWPTCESVLISSEHLEAKLFHFDDEHLYYITHDSRGRAIPFVLRRTADIESSILVGYDTQNERYDALLRGVEGVTDPLKNGYILVTSGATTYEFSTAPEVFNDYMAATQNKLDTQGYKTFLCRVRVIIAY